MKISTKGRYALAAMISLAQQESIPGVETLTALSGRLGLSKLYLEQVFSLLRRAELVLSVKGAQGGYRLARSAAEISLWDILEAIEGEEPAFRCSEIRQQGPCVSPQEDFRKPCGINAAFSKAETAWRAELKSVSIGDIAGDLARKVTPQRRAIFSQWLEAKLG